MMMAKPRASAAEKSSGIDDKEGTKNVQSSEDAVKDLERRLALLGNGKAENQNTNENEEENLLLSLDAPAPAVKPLASPQFSLMETSQVQDNPQQGKGKNALLARIMAAQERAKLAGKAKGAGEADLLQVQSPPAFDEKALPPPAFQSSDLPPPSFDQVELNDLPPPAFDQVEESLMMGAAKPVPQPGPSVAPSAPSYEDLMDLQTQHEFSPPVGNPEEEVILGMEGLSDEEKRVLLDEQRRIMEQIEKEKKATDAAIASAQADAFDSRSMSVAVRAASRGGETRGGGRKVNLGGGQEVALHGPERTKAAIKDGTAVLVQCVNCANFMQVTANATLMYCPVCAVVSPVAKNDGTVGEEFETEQMTADRQLAEQLQKEEYERGNEARRPTRSTPRVQTNQKSGDSSWWGTFSSMFTPVGDEGPPRTVGATTAGARPSSTPPRETERLVSSGGARVAERQPLFSCVVDSVSNAANTLGTAMTAQTIQEDREGNVHGVDASSLLAVPQVSRSTQYQKLPNDS